MGQQATINPTTSVTSSGLSNIGGAGDFAAAINDASDATYLTRSSVPGVYGPFFPVWVQSNLGTFTLGATEYVRDIVVNVRVLTAGNNPPNFYAHLVYAGAWWQTIAFTQIPTSTGGAFVDYSSSARPGALYYAGDPNQGVIPITQTVLDSLELRIEFNNGLTVRLAKASVTLTAPSYGGATVSIADNVPSLRPIFTYAYTPGAGSLGGQGYQHTKIFTDAQVTSATFDAESTVPVWSLETYNTSGNAVQIVPFLGPGVKYWVYFKIGDYAASGDPRRRHSTNTWVSDSFTISVLPPIAPTILTSSDPHSSLGPRIGISTLDQQNMVSQSQHYRNGTPDQYSIVAYDAAQVVTAIQTAPLPPSSATYTNVNKVTGAGAIRAVHGSVVGAAASSVNNKALYKVAASRNYSFQTYARASISLTLQFVIDWYDSSGNFISTTTTSGATISTTWMVYAAFSASFPSPAGAAYARIGYITNSVALGTNLMLSGAVFRPYDNAGALGSITEGGPGFNVLANKLPAANSSMETSDFTVAGRNTNCTAANDAVVFLSGLGSLKLTSAAAGKAHAKDWIPSNPVSPHVYVIPYTGSSLCASAMFRVASGTRTCFIIFDFYSISKTLIETKHITGSVTATAWTMVSGTVTVPAGASTCAMGVGFTATAGSEVINIDEFGVWTGTTPPQWAPNPSWYDPNEAFHFIERSIDGGVTWLPFRGINGITPTGTSNPTSVPFVNDYEVLTDIQIKYRAFTRAYISPYIAPQLGDPGPILIPVDSAYSAITNVTMSSPTTGRRWWLKDPYNSAANMMVDIADGSFQIKYPEDQAIYNPLGRSRKVFIADTVKGAEFRFTLDFIVEAEYAAFKALRNSQHVLLLQRWWTGEQWFIRLGDIMDTEEMNSSPVRRFVTMEAVEVDVPPDI